MSTTSISCPSCGIGLAVPEGSGGKIVRCGKCGQRFRIPETPKDPLEDVVASWLSEEDEDNAAAGDTAQEAQNVADAISDLEAAGETAAPPPSHAAGIRIVKIERRGVVFEFAASRLLETSFRCAFPRMCLSCTARAHLRAHIVIFAAQLVDSISLEAEHSTGTLVLTDAEVHGLSDEDILQRLPKVPNVPHPADLPMPYWICDMCSGAGVVSGQIHVNPETGAGWCRLFVRNPVRAAEFMAAVGGKDTPEYRALMGRMAEMTENPWDLVPEAIQHRLQQWFHVEDGERFLAYVPDRDHGRTEDGMAGIVVTDRRLVYHTPVRHRELKVDEPLELQPAMSVGKGRVSITTPGWELRRFTVDRDGLAKLRRALSAGKFRAVWH